MLRVSHAKRLPPDSTRPGPLLPSGQPICLCRKRRVLSVTSDSVPNGQISDTVQKSVADTRIMKYGKRSIHHRLPNGNVRCVARASSHGTIPDSSIVQPSVGTKCEIDKTTSRGKPLNATLPQRNDMMPNAQNERAKSPPTDTKPKRLTVNLPPETHRAFKVWCTQQGREMSEVVVEFIQQCLKKKSE